MRLTGKLRHVPIEGGVWLLQTADGRQYQLVPPPAGAQAGEDVEIEGDVDAGAVSFQMAGPLLRVRNLRRRS